MLFHVSDQPGIRVFGPRPSDYTGEPVVWAIDADHLRNYLVPRDCPRVTFYAGPATTADDRARFLGPHAAVVGIEEGWADRVARCRLHCYRMPPDTFAVLDRTAGYFVSRTSVAPSGVDVIDNPLEELRRRDVDVRIVPNLWPLRDAVVQSSLLFSMIRMKNALPRLTASGVELQIVAATDRQILSSMLDEYLRELFERTTGVAQKLSPGAYPYLDAYFAERDRYAWFIRDNDGIAGFALIRGPGSTGGAWEVAEFYVMPSRRRTGLGHRAMEEIWERLPGEWRLEVHVKNGSAIRFWSTCVDGVTRSHVTPTELEAADGHRLEFRFRTLPVPST